MRSKWRKFSTAFIAIMLFSVVAMSNSLGTISGQVLDSEGAVIPGAYLLFHYDHAGVLKPKIRPDVMRRSDAVGRFDVQLQPGFYDICIMAMSFTPECKKVLVVDGELMQHDARLKADPLVSQHLGDKF